VVFLKAVNYLPLLEPILNEVTSNARSAWWLYTSTYALEFVVVPSAPHCSLTLAPKTKKFPCLHIFGGGVRGGADKRLKGYFFGFGSPQ
jgi:hypothetical protein